jgi:hypothetical protein
MTQEPAPIDLVRQKLDARREEDRVVALLHAAAHGKAARSLAAKVAAMLEDESTAVQWHAVGTFKSIGAEAIEAVPVLLELRAKGAPPVLVSRATFCLGCVGPSACDAVPSLKAALRQAPADRDVLQALWHVAPDDCEVIDVVLIGAFSSNFSLFLSASDLLKSAKDFAIDRVFSEIATRTQSTDLDDHKSAARLLVNMAAKRPKLAADLLRELLRDPRASQSWHAVSAVRELPAPRPTDLVNAVIRVAAGDDIAAALRALEVLIDLGAEAFGAQDTFMQIIARNLEAHPVAGEEGWPASSLAAAAKGLAQICPSDHAVEPLLFWLRRAITAHRSARRPLSWLRRAITAHRGARRPLSWFPIGHVVEALASLSPTSVAVHNAILAAVAAARPCMDEDEAGVLDFDRAVRRAFERLSNTEEMFDKAEKLGMPRTDPYTSDDGPDQSDASNILPNFPPDGQTEPTATLAQLDEGARRELATLIANGGDVLGVDRAAGPQILAGAVDLWLRQLKRTRKSVADEDLVAVAVAYGEAIACATGWQWSLCQWEGRGCFALVSPEATHLHVPFSFIYRQLTLENDVTALLLFNMLVAGQRPDARPAELKMVG